MGISPEVITIDWTKAPEWANYAAMDSDGEWYFYHDEPQLLRGCWGNPPFGAHCCEPISATDWEETMKVRPGIEAAEPIEPLEDVGC